jgi:group I intron endonuclease
LAKLSEIRIGKTHSAETIARIKEAKIGRSMLTETKAKISKALSGQNHSNFRKSLSVEVKALISNIHKGKTVSTEAKTKISIAKGTAIYVYDTQGSLVNSFSSAKKAASHFEVSKTTILKYIVSKKIFKDNWTLSTFLISKE